MFRARYECRRPSAVVTRGGRGQERRPLAAAVQHFVIRGGRVRGVRAATIEKELDIPPAEIEPPPAFGTNIRTDFIFGMGKVAGKFVILLNIDKVLSVDEIALLTGPLVGAAETALPER